MASPVRSITAIILTGIWVSASEFLRNQFLLATYWKSHYQSLGLVFPSRPVNGMMWGLWSFLFAVAIFIIAKRFSLIQTTLLSWFMGFILMWIALWNLSVLPGGILVYAIPLSLVEAFTGSWICKKMQKKP